MCFLRQTFILHSITKKYNFIYIVKNIEATLPKFFEILPKFLVNQKFGGACAPPAPTTLYKQYNDFQFSLDRIILEP